MFLAESELLNKSTVNQSNTVSVAVTTKINKMPLNNK
jgi:hypothetical protein